ncbi:hypothetical protein BD560DRAFT_454136 [Blakeslea trispora]|nr:hypothetical protein BD560DRAFT_454136 [Blakeslea trispora]
MPLNLITTKETHHCEISERHHQTRPFKHVHSIESDADRDCVTGNEFNESTKQMVLPCLQSINQADVDWALNKIVTISYEYPQKLLLIENPSLAELLLQKAEAYLPELLFSESNTTAVTHKSILKILHIFRNFSFIESNVRVMAASTDLRQVLIKCLIMKDSSHYSHCIDILENMTPHIELGPFDPIIGCLSNLLMNTTERSAILGSIRVLTLLASSCTANLHFLLPTSTQIASRIVQLLIVIDEELIGTSLEYLYQYSSLSASFGQFLLELRNGADLGIIVSLLMTPCRYFRPLLTPPPDYSRRSSLSENFFEHRHHDNIPCMPNLSSYQQLDEPYRCLGWLKDKFELSSESSELSLDDMYLLYEMRFGHEKALRVKDFYTVLKIAFPVTFASGDMSPKQSAILEGTTIRGLQVKMCILQDGSELMCQWTNCSQSFVDEQHLRKHVLHDHLPSSSTTAQNNCMWMDCDEGSQFSDPNELTSHVKDSHFRSFVDTSEVKGVSLVAAQLLEVLSKNPTSHVFFMPYEQELTMMAERKPRLAPYIESVFSNFRVGSCSSSCSSIN